MGPAHASKDDVSEDDDSEDEEDSSDDDDEGLNESRRDLLNESTGVYAQQNVRGRLNSWSSNRSAASIEDDASGDGTCKVVVNVITRISHRLALARTAFDWIGLFGCLPVL